MPSSTPKQARTMAAAAHDADFAAKVGIPQPVAREFNQADAGRRISRRHGLTNFPHKKHSRNGR